ncbi:MAG: hypothetical protein V3U75_05610 [Methylococcaceae bacterium]
MEAARRRGKKLGRPRKLKEEQVAQARQFLEENFYYSMTELAESFHERTLIRALELKG